MRYRVQIVRIEAHPKAGQEIPRDHGGWNNGLQTHHPATVESEVLAMELDEAQFDAIRRSALEVAR